MKFNKSLIIISISILSCSLYPFNLVTTKHAAQSTPNLIARVSTLSKFVISAIYAHKYASAAAVFTGAMLLCPPIRRTIMGFLQDLFAPLWRRNKKETMEDIRHKAWLMGIDFDGPLKYSRDPVKDMIIQVQAAQARAASKKSSAANTIENQQPSSHWLGARRELQTIEEMGQTTPSPTAQDYNYVQQPEAGTSFCLAKAHELAPRFQAVQLHGQELYPLPHPIPASVQYRLEALASAARAPYQNVVIGKAAVASSRFNMGQPQIAMSSQHPFPAALAAVPLAAPPQPIPAALLSRLEAFRGPMGQYGMSQDSINPQMHEYARSFCLELARSLSRFAIPKTTTISRPATAQRNQDQQEVVFPQTIATGAYGTWKKCLVRAKKSDSKS